MEKRKKNRRILAQVGLLVAILFSVFELIETIYTKSSTTEKPFVFCARQELKSLPTSNRRIKSLTVSFGHHTAVTAGLPDRRLWQS